MKKTITWHGMGRSSEERCEVSASEVGVEVRGGVQGTTEDGEGFEINYLLELSPDWEIQHVVIRDQKNEGNEMDLQRENGQWFDVDGMHLEDLDGVRFVDISITPLTNTLPIKNLEFTGDETQNIDVLYIDLPSFTWRRVEQRYTKIGKNTYRYEDIELRGFTADLVVDDDGFVVVYPNLFTSAAETD